MTLQATNEGGDFTCLGQCAPRCGCGTRRGLSGAVFPSVPVATYPSTPRPRFAPVYHTPFAGATWPATLGPTRTRFAPMQDPRYGGVVQGLDAPLFLAEEGYVEQKWMIMGAISGALIGTYAVPEHALDGQAGATFAVLGIVAGKMLRRLYRTFL